MAGALGRETAPMSLPLYFLNLHPTKQATTWALDTRTAPAASPAQERALPPKLYDGPMLPLPVLISPLARSSVDKHSHRGSCAVALRSGCNPVVGSNSTEVGRSAKGV